MPNAKGKLSRNQPDAASPKQPDIEIIWNSGTQGPMGFFMLYNLEKRPHPRLAE
jgi:hypothetical protein